MTESRPRLVIVQRFLPHYRVAFLDRLLEELDARGYRFSIVFSRTIGTVDPRAYCVRVPAIALPLRLREISDTLVISPFLWRAVAALDPSVLVLEDVGGLPGNLQVAGHARRLGIPYWVWGLGRIPGKRPSRLRSLMRTPIARLHSGAAGFIGYSSFACSQYSVLQKPCRVALNCALDRHDQDQYRRVLDSIEARSNRQPLTLVTIGRILEHKRIDVLLRALAAPEASDVVLEVIGSGPAEETLRALAATLKITSRVKFHGEVYDRGRKLEILTAAHLGVLPGRGGLAVQELMWHGLPVISGLADGTESDIITPARGYRVDRLMTANDVLAAIRTFAALSPDDQRNMSVECARFIRTEANVSLMAASFASAVSLEPSPVQRSLRS